LPSAWLGALPSGRGGARRAVTRAALPQLAEATDFAAAVGRHVADECDRPYSALGFGEDGALHVREEPRGSCTEGNPEDSWRRFWGGLRREGATEAWHEELYWRLVRGQNCHVFAAQLAYAWLALKHSSAEHGEALALEHRGEPVINAYVLDGHLGVEDLLASTPPIYVQGCNEPIPTYGTIGRLYQLVRETPSAARIFGVRQGQEEMLRQGLELCASMGQDPAHVCTHRWFVLETASTWLHLDLCGMAYGSSQRSPSGWPMQSFETPRYSLEQRGFDAAGQPRLAVAAGGPALEALSRDAAEHRHFGLLRHGHAHPLHAEDAEAWVRQAPQSWLSNSFALAVRGELRRTAKEPAGLVLV